MKELMSGGATVIFVSHDIEKIKEMCTRVVWLNKGHILKVGDAKEICKEYKESQHLNK